MQACSGIHVVEYCSYDFCWPQGFCLILQLLTRSSNNMSLAFGLLPYAREEEGRSLGMPRLNFCVAFERPGSLVELEWDWFPGGDPYGRTTFDFFISRG